MLIHSYIQNREKHPIELIIRILHTLNSILVKQIDILHTKKVKIQNWQHPFEALSFKLTFHVASMEKLLEKSSIPYQAQNLEVIDIASINVITRAIIENYLTLYHFHFENVAEEQKVFRYLIYASSALKNRQSFTVYNLDNEEQLNHEKEVIDRLLETLKTNAYFLGLPLKNQEHYLKTKEAKQFNWTELLDKADLRPEFFKDTWRLLSNYAHSEFLSVLQIREYPRNFQQLNSNAYFMGEVCAMVLGRAISNTAIIFSVTKEIVDALEIEEENLLKYFAAVGKKGAS